MKHGNRAALRKIEADVKRKMSSCERERQRLRRKVEQAKTEVDRAFWMKAMRINDAAIEAAQQIQRLLEKSEAD